MGIMRKLNHHHIATLAFATQDSQGFCLYITPLAECDLGGYLRLENDRPRHHKEKVWKWFGCLLGALEYAHRNKVKHKDIKPENILIDEDGSRVYLTDFGLSRDFSNLGNSMTTRSPPLGTRMYFAPECISDGKRTTAVDIFALGCVFAEILGAIGG
jgi:serine/threonine protein kinase